MTDPKILAIRYTAIGDCVMTAWAVTALRNRWPESNIVWATQRHCAPVIACGPLVDEVAIVPREQQKREPWSAATWRENLRFYSGLRRQRFDVGFDFHGQAKTALCLRIAAPRNRSAMWAADVVSKTLNRTVPVSQRKHDVERVFDFVSDYAELEFPSVPILPDAGVERLPRRQRVEGRWATIQTGAGAPFKRYSQENWRQVAESLLADGWSVSFVGGPGDPQILVEGADDWVGKLSLRETMAAIHRCDLHLSGDTGTAHIAAAMRKPQVTLFGPSDPTRFRPYSPHAVVLRQSSDVCAIPPEQVLEATASFDLPLEKVRSG